MKQAFTLPKFTDQAIKQPLAKVAVRSLLVCISLWLLPTVAKADTPIPTQVVTSYNAGLQRLTVNVNWFWTSQADNKHVGVAVFADLNGDGIIPTVYDNPATYNSGGNPFPAGLLPRDEFLGQIALSNIEGSATSAMFPGIVDNTDNGIASTVPGVTPSTPRLLLPYGTNGQDVVNASGNDNGSFTVTYNGVPVSPTQICVILYDPHSPFKATGGHSVVSAGPDHNTDNSLEEGNAAGTVSCTTLTTLNCAQNKTEAACQTQAAINASYNAWLNSVTASGCNGTLTNNSTGAPSACGGSKTVTWTYTQNSCTNQAPVTTCTATFTVTADASAPVFTSCPSGANLGCNPSSIPPAGTPTATDNCGNSNITFSNSLGPVTSNGNQRTQTRTYVATDACGNSSTCQQVFTWTVCANTNPDFNVTYVNVPVPGNVSTNDVIPSGTSYGTPILTGSPAGSTQTISMSSSGSYTFVANMPGVYTYNVPVCVPGAVPPCPTETLTITVLQPNVMNNPPVANPDIAYTNAGTPVLIKTLENDKAGNPGGSLNPGSVTVTVSAANGTSSINPATGDNTYTPNAGFTGWDVLTYQVCDNSVPALCATSKQYIYVGAAGSSNSTFADDDYAFTTLNNPVSGNVKINDTDPEGHTQTVTAQTTTQPGKGTLVLSSNGNFTFTPVAGFSGPVNFVYTTCDNGVPQACASATLYVLVSPFAPVYNHDFNVTYVNVPVPGNVRTNDVVPPGTSYGTPTLTGSPAGSTQTISMNSTGSYTFVANTPGVYTYNVPVCIPGAVAPCPTTTLTITVLEPTITNNPPVANPDIAFTKVNTPVLIKTLENDKAGNPGGSLNPGSVTVTVSALNGSSSINPATGDNTYTPNPGFTGWDVLTYQVCDNNVPAMCASAKQYIYVGMNNAPNSTLADDDYAYTQMNTSVTGNVKTNDTDPEGHTQTVTAQTTTVPGKGTLVLNANGTFTFTPVSGFTGPVNFTYTTCDNGTPQACASATLYVLVSPPLTMYNHDFNVTYVNVPVPGDVRLNDVVPAGTTYGTPTLTSSPAGSTQTISMNPSGTYTFVANKPGVYVYTVPVCIPGAVAPCPTTTLTITVLDPVVNNNPPVANPDIAVTKVNTPVLIYTLLNDNAGNPGGTLNPASVTVTVAALNGSSSINPATGNNTYTPNPGFTGWDVLTYQVCDNSVPALCATSKQYIYVQANNSVNTTFADDDYAYTHMNVAVSGNVKTNDSDAEGHIQTVTSQNTTIPGKGTLSLDASGAFTFTPVAGFTGPVSFPYTTCDNGTPQACASATIYILVAPPASLYNPDFNVTYVNVTVPGNVRTNDIVPAGTTYGTPTLTSSPGGSTQTVVMNPDGTYTFVANTPGVYTYNVPVCVPGAVAPCPTSLLTITVLAPNTGNNPPVANTDIAFTKVGVPVLIKSLENDKAGNPGGSLNPASVTVTVAAANGTSSINPATGDNTYTPNPGFTGWDVLTYRVCDNSTPTPLCATAQQYIYVYPNAVPNTTLADDDYAYTNMNVAVTGNVKTNDTDPEGNTQTVTAQTTTVPGKGTLVLAADGTYTFTPVNGFTGPVSFVYTTCDNGVPSACASATLYVMVAPLNTPDFTPTHDIDALTFAGQTTQRDMIININEVLNGHSVGQVQFKVRKVSAFTMTYNPTATTANVFGGTAVNNSDWLFTEDANFITVTLKPGVVIPPYGVSRIGFTLTRNPGVPVNTTQNITTTIVTGSGGDTNSANNQAVTSITAN